MKNDNIIKGKFTELAYGRIPEGAELMGKGDKKTKKGKIFSGSYGNTRPRKKTKGKQK